MIQNPLLFSSLRLILTNHTIAHVLQYQPRRVPSRSDSDMLDGGRKRRLTRICALSTSVAKLFPGKLGEKFIAEKGMEVHSGDASQATCLSQR